MMGQACIYDKRAITHRARYMRRPFHVFRSNYMMRGNKTKYPPLSVNPRSSAPLNDSEKKSVTNTSAPPCKTTTTTKCDKKKRKIGVYRLLCRLQILSFFREEIAPLKPFVGCVGIGRASSRHRVIVLVRLKRSKKLMRAKCSSTTIWPVFVFFGRHSYDRWSALCELATVYCWLSIFFIILGHKSPLKVYEMLMIDGAFVQASGWDQTQNVARNQNTRDLFLCHMKTLRNSTSIQSC